MENNLVLIENNTEARISLADFSDEIKLVINENSTSIIDLVNLKSSQKISIESKNNSNAVLRFLIENDEKTLDLQAFLSKNASLDVYFADYSHGNSTIKSKIILSDEHAKTDVHFTSLTEKEEKKSYDISFEHHAKNTKSNFECFGVAMDSSFLKINGSTHIQKDMNKCEAHQKAKVILFDETSRAIANPILKIDCDDIIASHACAIGSLNSNHIFYLLSRGLSLEDARKLITTGYLLPIREKFADEEKDKITKYVEGDF